MGREKKKATPVSELARQALALKEREVKLNGAAKALTGMPVSGKDDKAPPEYKETSPSLLTDDPKQMANLLVSAMDGHLQFGDGSDSSSVEVLDAKPAAKPDKKRQKKADNDDDSVDSFKLYKKHDQKKQKRTSWSELSNFKFTVAGKHLETPIMATQYKTYCGAYALANAITNAVWLPHKAGGGPELCLGIEELRNQRHDSTRSRLQAFCNKVTSILAPMYQLIKLDEVHGYPRYNPLYFNPTYPVVFLTHPQKVRGFAVHNNLIFDAYGLVEVVMTENLVDNDPKIPPERKEEHKKKMMAEMAPQRSPGTMPLTAENLEKMGFLIEGEEGEDGKKQYHRREGVTIYAIVNSIDHGMKVMHDKEDKKTLVYSQGIDQNPPVPAQNPRQPPFPHGPGMMHGGPRPFHNMHRNDVAPGRGGRGRGRVRNRGRGRGRS